MDIKVNKEDSKFSHLTGGEYATCDVVIYVDETLPLEEQRELVIHAVLENYFRSIPHDKIDELTSFITEALSMLPDIT